MTPLRFAFYGRVSTTDKQDPALSFPSQLKACVRKAAELGGEITCEFTDQESGAKQDRAGWTALTHEAQDREGRRFDAVVIYNTSRLARDRLAAALYERELRKVDVPIHYSLGAGDPTTAEGQMFVALQQIWDEYERNKLSRETKRGMREATEQGYRSGGRAPHGYRRCLHELPEGHRGDREKRRVTLEPEPDEAAVVAEIFHLFVERGLGFKAIADHLNRPGGPPSPRHVDPKRNLRRHWAATTIRSMLQQPVYTGRMVWNRLDFASARQYGHGPRLRAKEDWVIAEDTHLPLVSDDLYEAAQAKLENRTRHRRGQTKRNYLFAGMVHCCTGHQALSMQGKARKDHHYYACNYGENYGDVAALETHAGQKWIYLREDALLPLVERFFAQRIFGPMRLEKLAKQLKAHEREQNRSGKLASTRLRKQIAEAERKIKLQVQALEDGIEPELVSARIAELRAERQDYESALAEFDPADEDAESEYLTERLARIPDLAETLRAAPPEVKRQTFEAFGLKVHFDKVERRIEVSATISEAVAQALEQTEALRLEGFRLIDGDSISVSGDLVTVSDIAGAGFEPATFGL